MPHMWKGKDSMAVSKVVQIKGSNGSGKTTLMKNLISLSHTKYYLQQDGGKPYATILDDLQWCVIGYYPEDKGMGGCDNIHTVQQVKDILLKLVEIYPGYWIVFEGMMLSTTMTMYYYMLELQQSHHIIPHIVVLKSTPEGCLKRIEKRRGSPLERTELVTQKCELVLKHQYDNRYVTYIDVDTLTVDEMLPTFLFVIGDDLVYSRL